ncbi:MAG: pyridoxal phosphate-dependent aminotransferase [Myxococcota bacterium]
MPRHPHASPSIAAMPASPYSNLAGRAAASGRPVVPLHVGDTWLLPPAGSRMEDLRAADCPGLHNYAPVRGLPALLDAIVDRTRAATGEAVTPDQLLVTGGATAGLSAVVGALVAPGDEVLILAPYWPLIAGIVATFSGVPVAVPVLHDDVPSPEALLEALRARLTDRTVAVYVNTPNNPTGRILPAPALEAIAAFARDHDLWLVADEVYDAYTYGDAVHVPLRTLAPDRTFAAYSFSKTYGMAGNRAGYVVGPARPMADVAKIGVYTLYSAPTASQYAALAALRGQGDAWVADARARYAEVGAEAAARLGVPAPQGSTFLFLDASPALDDRGLAGLLGDCADRGVLVAPGDSFGPFPHHLRLCYTSVPREQVLEGVDVVAALLGRSR